MEKRHPHITYTIVDTNRECDTRKALKEAIIEKLLLIHRNVSSTSN